MPATPGSTPRLLWLYPDSLLDALDAATWTETTVELRSSGWRVDLVMAGTPEQSSVNGVAVVPLRRPKVYLWGQFAYHLRFLRLAWRLRRDLDVVLVHPISVPWLLIIGVVRRLSGVASPLLVMDSRTLHMPDRKRQGLKDRLRERYYDLIYRVAPAMTDGQLTITRRLAESIGLPKRSFWGAWPSGVRIGPFSEAAERRRWPAENDSVKLVYVGSLSFERNLIELCEAALAANKAGTRFELLLIGEGSAANALKHLADGSGGAIALRPSIAHAAVPDVLASAHVGVLPFPDEEKFRVSSPIKLFEYLASGLPVLATRIACHTDVLHDAPCVFWAESAEVSQLQDALSSLWQGRDKLGSMGMTSSVLARSWTWGEAAEKLRGAIEPHLTTRRDPPVVVRQHVM